MISWYVPNTNELITESGFNVTTNSISVSIDFDFFTEVSNETRVSFYKNWMGDTYIQNVNGETGQTVSPAVFNVQTSTTITLETLYEYYSYLGQQPIDSDLAGDVPEDVWTYSTNESGDVVFFGTAASTTTYDTIFYTTSARTLTESTYLAETQGSGRPPYGTVYLANDSEIIYLITENNIVWGEFSAASNVATTCTRTTVYPSFITVSNPLINAGSQTFTNSFSQSAVTSSVSWIASTTVSTTKTRIANVNRLPNSTISFTSREFSTTLASRNFAIFQSNSGTVGFDRRNAKTTINTNVWSTYPRTVSRQFGSKFFQSTAISHFSTERIIELNAALFSSVSFSYQTVDGGPAQPDTAFDVTVGSTGSYARNTTIEKSGVSTDIAGFISRSDFSTTGVVLGTQTSGFFIGGNGFFLRSTAYDGQNVRARTIMPVTDSYATINSDSITFTTTSDDQRVTRSFLVGVAGESQTTTIQTGESIGGATSIRDGATFVETPNDGVYKDQINGTTTFFLGHATAYTKNMVKPRRHWRPITHLNFSPRGG